ncbi:MAG: response regulator [Hydrococcus sp. Prado102]|jgi:PAS domain S-box-containing protein|nr:response regulator [Hydrococcus sp. Prado102]
MNDEQFRQQIQAIHQQMMVLNNYAMQLPPPQREQFINVLEEVAAAFNSLQLIGEEMQTSLELSAVVEEELFEQNQKAIAKHQYYHDLFQLCPEAYLVTDANGLILDANRAIASLLNVTPNYLIRKPLAIFVPQSERYGFRAFINQLASLGGDAIDWQVSLCPKQGEPFSASLIVAIARNDDGFIETLRICVREIGQYERTVEQPEERQTQVTTFFNQLPQALDGLQVLVVEDEADTREFLSAVLESHGIRVTAVTTAAEALEAVERLRPNVLISDIRMPDGDGYSLIRQVKEWETRSGWHISAAAFTAYLEEDRSKALAAGFESHLHKLAQPTELIEMVTQLAKRASA